MSKLEKPITTMMAEQDLAYMKRNKEKIIEQVGQAGFDRLVEKLENYIRGRKRPGQAADSGICFRADSEMYY